MIDPIGLGQTRIDAICDLLAHPEFVVRARMGEWPLRPGLDIFVEAPAWDGACEHLHSRFLTSDRQLGPQ
jgi:hypothetical protein